MHLLYLDDSGSVGNADDRHIVLAGIAVFERQPHWFSQKLDAIAERVWPDDPYGIEFRASDMFAGRRHWRGVGKHDRMLAYREALEVLESSSQVRIFAAVIHKAALSPDDPMEYAFEQLCNRFDRFLLRLHRKGDTQRGMIILDDSSYETSLQSLAHNFRREGHRWGRLSNLCDVPMFVNSKATRMIQYADLVAYALRQYYEKGNSAYFDIIAPRLDAEGGVVHGLVHYRPVDLACGCHACRQRRSG